MGTTGFPDKLTSPPFTGERQVTVRSPSAVPGGPARSDLGVQGRPQTSSPPKPHRRLNLPSSALAKTRRSGVLLNRRGSRTHAGPLSAPTAHAQGWPVPPATSSWLPPPEFRHVTRAAGLVGGAGRGTGRDRGRGADPLFPDPAFPGDAYSGISPVTWRRRPSVAPGVACGGRSEPPRAQSALPWPCRCFRRGAGKKKGWVGAPVAN